ncbi:restriction endonuclease, partial [bacterium]|nr:restriction endonuclease [bacterium]
LVQCKQWKTFKVGVKVVREFFGVIVANSTKGGFVVTPASLPKTQSTLPKIRILRSQMAVS